MTPEQIGERLREAFPGKSAILELSITAYAGGTFESCLTIYHEQIANDPVDGPAHTPCKNLEDGIKKMRNRLKRKGLPVPTAESFAIEIGVDDDA